MSHIINNLFNSTLSDNSEENKQTNKQIIIVYNNRYNNPPPLIPHLFAANRPERIFNQIKMDNTNIIHHSSGVMISEDDLLSVHIPNYLSNLNDKTILDIFGYPIPLTLLPQKYIDNNFIIPARWQTAGTCLALEHALKTGGSINIGGGFIHAKRKKSSNRNIFSDICIAIEKYCQNKRTLVINLDANQADGILEYVRANTNVFLFDMYNKNIEPSITKINKTHLVFDIDKSTNVLHIPLDGGRLNNTVFNQTNLFNIKLSALDPWNITKKIVSRQVCDHVYIRKLQQLPEFIDKVNPDVIIYNSGGDIHCEDSYGCMNVSKEGMIVRDLFVWQHACIRKIPICMTLGEGFASDIAKVVGESIENIVEYFPKFIQNKNLESYYDRLAQLI